MKCFAGLILVYSSHAAYPPHLNSPEPLLATWKSPFQVECPYKIGVLRDQYTMVWNVIGAGGVETVDSNSSDYKLVGSSLIISNFNPFIVKLICRLTVRGTDDFVLQPAERRDFSFQPITIESG